VFPAAQRYGLGVLTFSPLNGGWLSGHADPTSGHRASLRPSVYDPSTPTGQLKAAAVKELAALAGQTGLTLPQLATAFVRAHPAVTSSIASTRSSRREPISTPGITTRPRRPRSPTHGFVAGSGAGSGEFLLTSEFTGPQHIVMCRKYFGAIVTQPLWSTAKG